MIQPDELRSDAYLPWSRGRGTDVWEMLRAAMTGDLATVGALVSRAPNLLDCEFQYYRPLHFAVRENRPEVVRFLLDRGADPMCGGLGFRPAYKPEGPNNHQWPFTMARERGYAAVLALLESKVAEKHRIVPQGETLAAMIRDRDLDRVRAALDASPDVIDAADAAGNQPLHWAVMTRQLPVIDLLLRRGADINALRPDGARPLDLSNGDYWYRGWQDLPAEALQPHEVVIGYLLARGAEYDISTAAKLGDLARVRAMLNEHPSLANAIPPSTGYYNGVPLRCAAGGGHLDVVKLLLKRGANPNQPEPVAPWGGALHEAIGGRHWDVVKLLLQHGANPNAMIESSGNCMWRARGAPREILDLLAAHGGVLGLEMACYEGDVASVEQLLQANPDLPIHRHLDTDREALVQLALRYQPDVLRKVEFGGAATAEHARWLFHHGVDPGRGNWLGVTPLHRFALRGQREMASLCLEFGARINAIDDEFSSSPLGWAARAGQKEMVAWLLARGADAALPRDRPWARPSEWARRGGFAEIAALLNDPHH